MSKTSLKHVLSAIASLAISGTLIFGFNAGAQATTPAVAVPNKVINSQSVGIQMFMWNWRSIKRECTTYLGPNGIDWVQISPPQEHVTGGEWWVHYQPVSYRLDSSLGTRAEFIDMVQTCNGAGVQIIADAVINHMAARSGTGFAGSTFSKYEYPGLYAPSDFHYNLVNSDPRFCNHNIANYDAIPETTSCELGSLPDLATEKPNVRQSIADYLNDMIDIGVAGFRVDAAKHIGSEDLSAIVGMLHTVNGHQPWIGSETIGGSEVNMPFTHFGDVWAWDMVTSVDTALSANTMGFAASDWSGNYTPSANTITFISNHDTEHHENTTLTYANSRKFLLAHEWLLAVPFGKPELYTGYTYDFGDEGAPGEGDGVTDAVCASSSGPILNYVSGKYVCMHRWRAIAGMIQWRDAAGTGKQYYTINNKLPNNGRILQFNRGTSVANQTNFIAFNPGPKPQKKLLLTHMPRGVYCDVITGGRLPVKSNKTCTGTTITVVTGGKAYISVPAYSAVAFNYITKAK